MTRFTFITVPPTMWLGWLQRTIMNCWNLPGTGNPQEIQVTNHNWMVVEESFEPERVAHYETVFTQGNGFLGTRGSFEEYYPGKHNSTFAHGVFDDVAVSFTELANLPDWTELFVDLDGETFSMASGEVLGYRRSLDLK